MSLTPKQVSASVVESAPFIDIRNARSEACTLSADTVDGGNTPTTQLRRGLCVGYDGGTGDYIDAGDASVDTHDVAVVDSSEAPDGDWASQTLTVDIEGLGALTRTLDAGISNLATAIADINNSALGAFVTASNNGAGRLRLTANKPFSRLSVSSGLSTAYGGVTVSDDATPTKYGLLQHPIVSMLDPGGTAVKKNATIITANAIVREADVPNLTQAARQYFAANGVIFE